MLSLTLLVGGCIATPINLPNNDGGSGYKKDSGGTTADAASMKDQGTTQKDGGQPWADAGATADQGAMDQGEDGLTDGLLDGAPDATGEAGPPGDSGGEASVGKDALSGE